MGHCFGKKSSNRDPSGEDHEGFKKKKVDQSSNFNFGLEAFIKENPNKITREYNLLSPPLGQGAFGEVRQAVNRQT